MTRLRDKLIVTIEGPIKGGKSTLAQHLAKLLEANGIAVTVEDDNHPDTPSIGLKAGLGDNAVVIRVEPFGKTTNLGGGSAPVADAPAAETVEEPAKEAATAS
jgi:energy-coupling factor transporter ATP-binding protein EcfA2